MDKQQEEININFGALWAEIKKQKIKIFFAVVFSSLLGYAIASSMQDQFISKGKILPEMQQKGGSMDDLSGLAALAGVDIGGTKSNSTDAIRPDLYPSVLTSSEFFLTLLSNKFYDKNGKLQNFREYLKNTGDKFTLSTFTNIFKSNKIALPNQKIDGLSPNILLLSLEDENYINALKTKINCEIDKKTGILEISSKMPDPVMAASIANFSIEYLKEYIINYRTLKQKRDVDFLAERLSAAKGKYYNNQERKASYSDKLPLEALRMNTADLQRERIESDYRISTTMYNSLLSSYEEAKLRLQQETPIVKVLDAPAVPNLKSEPKKALITLVFALIGLLTGLVWILIKIFDKIFVSFV